LEKKDKNGRGRRGEEGGSPAYTEGISGAGVSEGTGKLLLQKREKLG